MAHSPFEDETAVSAQLGQPSSAESTEIQPTGMRELLNNMRASDERDRGSVPVKSIAFVGAAVLGVCIGFAGAHEARNLPFGVPGAPRIVAEPPSASIQGEATLKGLLVTQSVDLGTGVGYTYAGVGYKAAAIGGCWKLFNHDINPSCVRQSGLAVFGSPPEGQKPPKGFPKDKDGAYHYTADPELQLSVPGEDIYFYLGWVCKSGVEGCTPTTIPKTASDDEKVTYYPIAYVVKNNVKRQFVGQSADSSHFNSPAAAGSIGKDVDMSSFSDVAKTVAEENFINACTSQVEETSIADVQLETHYVLSSAGNFVQSAGAAMNDPEKIAVGRWVTNLSNVKADVIFGTSESSIRKDLDAVSAVKELASAPPFSVNSDPVLAPRHELPADFTPIPGNKLQLPPVFEETKETLAKANSMSPSNITWDVKPDCHVSAATNNVIEQIKQLEALPAGVVTGLPPAVELSRPVNSPIPSEQADNKITQVGG
jgi:hypothetical protein